MNGRSRDNIHAVGWKWNGIKCYWI